MARRPLWAWALAALATLAQAQGADPWADWQSADSAHFRIHYKAGQRQQAERVAQTAERALTRAAEALAWQPRGRPEIIVLSESDLANGFSTPLPFNRVGVLLAPPDDGALLDNSAWLDLLLTHELTHTVHLDKVRGAPSVLQRIFGRVPWFMPNLFEPGWVLEGLAVYRESDPAPGRGRLQSPAFEAWLRAERAHGFISLAELNADGRALPVAKQYLYGAYFFDFLARHYGADKPAAFVERYSGNIVPRLHSNPLESTGKTLDVLWDEFLADLAQQVDARSATLALTPETMGTPIAGPLFDVPSLKALPGGALLAVVDDGRRRPQLVRFEADGSRRTLTGVNAGARVSAAADGRVLVTQPDICRTHYLAYDVYRLEGDRLRQLTHCAHLRRAVQAAGRIAALKLDAGRTRLVTLADDGSGEQDLWQPPAGTDLVDLVVAPEGRRLSLIAHAANDWRLLQIDLDQPGTEPALLLRRGAPMHDLRHGARGIELVTADGGVDNVWRLEGGVLKRLTHSHTGVVAHAGTADDGSLSSVSVAHGGQLLRRLAEPQALQTLASETLPPAPAASSDADTPLGEGSRYSALRSIAPRSWLPAVTLDHGLTAYGALTNGGDALGWHTYAALLQAETTQKELLGTIEYRFIGAHHFALSRTLAARAWTGSGSSEETTVFERRTRAQWVSLLPWLRLERRIAFGVGAVVDVADDVNAASGSKQRLHDERIGALLFDYDSRGANWSSEGPDRGQRATLLYESYKPFGEHGGYDGAVLRADLRAFVPLGRHVLGLRWTEARADGRTEPFQLGGAIDENLQLGIVLDSRKLALRGYRGDEPELAGRNARIASVEWRFPLADIDRHGMVPPVGIRRLSGTLFFEAGGAWNEGSRPADYHRAAGFEMLGELQLLYALELQLRFGVARGLDAPKGTRAYLTIGRAF